MNIVLNKLLIEYTYQRLDLSSMLFEVHVARENIKAHTPKLLHWFLSHVTRILEMDLIDSHSIMLSGLSILKMYRLFEKNIHKHLRTVR